MGTQRTEARTSAGAAVAIGLAAVLAAAWLFHAPRPQVPAPLALNPGQLRPFLATLSEPAVVKSATIGLVIARAGSPECSAALVPMAVASPAARRFGAYALEPAASADLSCLAWFDAAAARLTCADPPLPVVRPGTDVPPLGPLDRWLLVLSALLVGALPVMLFLGWRRLERPERQMALAVVVVAVTARLLWPWRLTAVYFAYEWFAQAAYLDSVPRYGPGSTALWGMVLGPQTDHRAVLGLQALVGAGTCAVWATAVARAARRVQAGWWAGLALAVTPVVLRDHTSESMHVPALLGVAAASWAAVELALQPSRLFAALLAGGCAFAALSRFEVGPQAVATAAVFSWIAAPQRSWRASWSLWILPGLAVVLTLARAVEWAARDLQRGNLPQLDQWSQSLPRHLVDDVLLWRGDWLPLGAWVPVLWWLAWGRREAGLAGEPPRHHRWLALLPLALAAALPSWLDYNETSLPRLQQPAAQLLLLCGAALAAQLAHQNRGLRPWRSWAIAGLWLLTAVPTWATCLRQTNPHQEDQLLVRAARDLADRVPAGQNAWLAVRSYADGDTAGLHLHQPTYAFESVRLTTATAAARVVQQCPNLATPLYFLQSLRCAAAPIGAVHPGLVAPCAELSQQPSKVVLWRDNLINLRDSATFDWYGREPAVPVGLYQLTP